jgi:PAS domain S-box-containing protein
MSSPQSGRDIYVVKRAGQPALADSLRLSEEVFRAIFQEAGIGMALVSLAGRPIEVNRALEEILGYTAPELCRMTFPELTHPDDVAVDVHLFEELVRGERERYRLDKRYIRKDGSLAHGRLTVSLVRDAGGHPRFAVEMVEDITDHKRAQAERQLLLARLVGAHEEERRRIAEDLHDDPVQQLTAVSLRLGRLRTGLPEGDLRAIAQDVESRVSSTISRLRSLMFDLRPIVLDRRGLGAAVQEHLSAWERETGVSAFLEDRLRVEPDPEAQAAAYRIIVEALVNVRKHAEARSVRVMLADREGGVLATIEDDGRGLPRGTARQGHIGLSTMRERAQLSGGWLDIVGGPEEGTTVTFWVPRADSRPEPTTTDNG